jgi:diaminohydroxyphosphoribosylaminopyrimidine deaminase/5-amino-6-(5-phosphoribosylamino)uracil reductase
VKADDPLLTCRIEGLEERSPVRVVLDTQLSISESSQLVQTAKQHPTWIITANADSPKAAALRENGVKIIACTSKDNRMVLKDAFAILGKEGITRMLVEAGGNLTGEMLKSELVDRIYWFRAPFAIGSDGMCGVNAEFGLPLSALTRYTRKEMRILGNDVMETYEA